MAAYTAAEIALRLVKPGNNVCHILPLYFISIVSLISCSTYLHKLISSNDETNPTPNLSYEDNFELVF